MSTTEGLLDHIISNALTRVRAFDAEACAVTLWVVQRHGRAPRLSYSVRPVAITQDVEGRFRRVLLGAIDRIEGIEPYAYISEDSDNRGLYVPKANCDFARIAEAIGECQSGLAIANPGNLTGAWGYVLMASHGSDVLYAFRATRGAWAAAKQRLFGLVVRGETLDVIEEGHVFHLDDRVDFLATGDDLIILDKARFEAGMDFRRGIVMEANQVIEKQIIEYLVDHGDNGGIASAIGQNMRALRKIAMLADAAHLDSGFLERLRHTSEEGLWELEFADDGRIIFRPELLDEIITALSDDRLRSPVNQTVYNVASKRKHEAKVKALALAKSGKVKKGKGDVSDAVA